MGAKFTFNTRELGAKAQAKLQACKDCAKRAMDAVGYYAVREAKKRAPVDEGILTEGITAETIANNKTWTAHIYIPINHPSSAYAVAMHENQYELGDNSRTKQAKVGCVVGRKYITRAIEDNHKLFTAICINELEKLKQ